MKTYTLTSRTPWRVGFSVATVAALFVAVSLTGYGADSNSQTQKKSSKESLTLELGPEQLTVRRNGQEQAFDKESKEYKELIRAYQRLVERVDQKSDYPLYYPEKQRQETEVQIAKDRAAKVSAQLADLQAERKALEAARRAEKRQHALQLQVAEEALAKAKQEQEMVLHGYARAGKESPDPFGDQAQDPPAQNYAQISPEGRYKTERMTGTYNSGQMTGSHDKGEMTGRYAYAQSKSRYAQSYHPDAPESSPYRSNQINDQRRGLEILQKELAANQRELERQQKELQRSIRRQQEDLKRQQVALEQQWKQAEIEQQRVIKEQRQLRAEYADLAKAYEVRAREQDKLAKEHEAQAKRQQALLIRIRQELAEIGAIDKSWRNLDIDLNGQRLEINGKRQPEDVYLRTKEIYQEATGEELRGTLRLKTNK